MQFFLLLFEFFLNLSLNPDVGKGLQSCNDVVNSNLFDHAKVKKVVL